MRVLVVGAGAVGGYFGGRLVQAGRDVTFLVRAKQAEQFQSFGLRILSPTHGDFTVRPKTITASQIASPYDLIFVSVKSFDLAAAMNDFAPAVGPQTAIIPVLNGMHHMDVLTQRFGKDAVLGGVCYVATQVDAQGRIVQLADVQSVTYGELDGKKTPRIEAVDQTFQGAGFDAAVSADILRDMWEKWVWLATVGAITCLLRGNIGEIVAAGGAELSRLALRECAAIAAACGYPMPKAFLADNSANLTARGSSLTSSMYRDLRDHAPRVEADTILGDLLDRGRKHDVSAPIVEAAFVSLSIYQQAQARAKAASS